ncbi:M60 family metallopeptidase, partial [Streptomyces sp. B1866]|uniref:M60 family metallopeptidase n=1 Tax=Streptomyces sp. B1866 TaxID=3075431 RepID=UPI00288C9AD7
YLAGPVEEKDLTKADLFVRLVMLEQLRLAFGEGYYPKFHKEARAHGDSNLYQGDAKYRRYFMVTASRAAGKDLTDFFVKWGMKPDAETREAIAALKLPQPGRDLTKIRLPAYSAGFGEAIVQVPGSTTTEETEYWVFSGGRYARVAVESDGSSRIVVSWRDVTVENWPSLKGRTQVDAALALPGTDGVHYVFSGDEYAKIKISGTTDTQLQDWRSIADYWPSLKGRPAGISEAVPVPGADDEYYVFSGDEYIRIKIEGTTDSRLQDWRSIADYWSSLRGRSTLDAVMRVPGSATATPQYWVFSDDEYATIELKGTQDINLQGWRPKGKDWPALRP